MVAVNWYNYVLSFPFARIYNANKVWLFYLKDTGEIYMDNVIGIDSKQFVLAKINKMCSNIKSCICSGKYRDNFESPWIESTLHVDFSLSPELINALFLKPNSIFREEIQIEKITAWKNQLLSIYPEEERDAIELALNLAGVET